MVAAFCVLRAERLSKSSVEDLESRAPVGSSAKINSGSVIIALAAAALCF